MSVGRWVSSASLVLLGLTGVGGVRLAGRVAQAPASSGLTIVVVEGEDAINIVRQGTAVAPVVEVRDRNNQPVAGAVVRFAIRGGRATFSGSRTLTMTTNALGRAAVGSLTPTGAGAVEITASATFQGQAAVATIAQTNVLTAAQAAGAAGAGSAGGGAAAGGGGAAGGGAAGSAVAAGAAATGAAAGGAATGISTATIVVIGGAAAGGTLATLQAVGGSSNEGWWAAIFQGSFTVATTEQIQQNGRVTCVNQLSITGTMTADLDGRPDGSAVDGHVDESHTEVSVGTTCGTPRGSASGGGTFNVDGNASAIQFSRVESGPAGPTGGGTASFTTAFTGAVVGDTLTGTLTLTKAVSFPNAFGVGGQAYSVSIPVTLKKP